MLVAVFLLLSEIGIALGGGGENEILGGELV